MVALLLIVACGPVGTPIDGQFLGHVSVRGEDRILLWHADVDGAPALDTMALAPGEDPYWLRVGDTLHAEIRHGALAGVRRTSTVATPKDFVPGGHAISGQLVRVDDDGLVLDHGPVPGVMPPMVMPFDVRDRGLLDGLAGGDRVSGLLYVADRDYWLVDLRKVAAGAVALRTDVKPVTTAAMLPGFDLPLSTGQTTRVGDGQGVPTALTFVYTRCPDPDFCPATTLRLQGLQAALPDHARIVTVTLDPDYDTAEVLADHGAAIGADPEVWQLGRVDGEDLRVLALRAGMDVTLVDGKIVHALRMLVLDADGRLLERYDDNDWPLDRVVSQLGKGVPMADPGTLGSRYPKR